VDDVAEIFTRLIQKETLAHRVYHTGGNACTLAEMAGVVKAFIPGADISFDEQASELPFAHLVDNSRLTGELTLKPRGLKEGILDVINRVRANAGLDFLG
jgi:nucleoside-diphosphate-sugar epimerase